MSAESTRGNDSLESSYLPVKVKQAKPTVGTNTFELAFVGSFPH
jgi:hypothetical protein